MKNGFVKIISLLSSVILLFNLAFIDSYAYHQPSQYFYNEILNNSSENNEIDWDIYDDFVKYDLCITDYDQLTEEKKELCKFVFETERSKFPYVRCERARRILDNRKVTERLTLDDIQDTGYIVDPDDLLKSYQTSRVFAVPDIVYSSDYITASEYWLDDDGNRRIIQTGFGEAFEYVKFIDGIPNLTAIEAKNIRNNIYTSDIWSYVLLPDETALIVDSSLPKYSDVVPIDETVTIPTELDGHTVSGIGESLSHTGITELIVPENITYLSHMNNMPYLEKVEINAPELIIKDMCFINCPSLKTAELNVKEICGMAFLECSGLENVNITGAEKIKNGAFVSCESLKTLVLPENLKVIGQLSVNTPLKNIIIPKNVEIIGAVSPAYETSGFVNGKVTNILVDTLKENKCVFNNDCTIQGYYNTEAHKYALENKLNFYSIDENISYGDLNNDGNINIADAVGLQKYILGNGLVGFEADMNRDGVIDVFDMIIMRQKLITSEK